MVAILIIIIMKLIIILKYEVLYIKKPIPLYRLLYSIVLSILFARSSGNSGIPLILLIIIGEIDGMAFYITLVL